MRLRPPILVLSLAMATAAPGLAAGPTPGARPQPNAGAPRPPVHARPAWLGIEMQSTLIGVRVEHVVRGSPADKAGMKEGDRVVRVDGVTMQTPSDVLRAMAQHHEGESVDVAFVRQGKEQTVKAALIARPSLDDIMRMEHVGTFAPGFAGLAPASGAVPASVQALRGRVAVIEFWAIWCGPCRMTMPILDGWQAKYGAQGLSVVGITTDPQDKAAIFAAQSGTHYAIASDPTGATTEAYGVRSIPALFVVDKRGVVREVSVGYEPGGETRIEHLVQQLLAEPAPPKP